MWPVWSSAATAAAKRIAASPAGRKAAQQAAAAASQAVSRRGGTTVGRWQASRGSRDKAYRLARQMHGQVSEAILIGSPETTHWIVWKDGRPTAAFPHVDGDLAERHELQHVTDEDRHDPPPAK